VNSLELEGLRDIAGYYLHRFQNGVGDVAVCTTKVFAYNEAGKKCGVDIEYDETSACWKFKATAHPREDAYRHRPVTGELSSPSHCGVEFVRALKEHGRSQFARRLSGRRFHRVKVP
jgi:hypothetical protein